MAIALAGLARFALRRWGGPTPSLSLDADPAASVRRASWNRALPTSLVLLATACLALSPLAGCVLTIVGKGNAAEATTQTISLIYYHLLDPAFIRILFISLTVGLAAALIDGALVRVLIGRGGRLSERVARRLIAAMDHVPATAIGFGTLALASLLVGGSAPGPQASRGLAEWLDPRRTPAVPLVLALAAAYLSKVAHRSAARTDLAKPELAEAALAMGASPRQSRRMARGPGSDLRSLIFITALAASSISPALLLTPASDFRPLAPAMVDALDDPPRASAIGLVVFLVTAIGYAFAFGSERKENETR